MPRWKRRTLTKYVLLCLPVTLLIIRAGLAVHYKSALTEERGHSGVRGESDAGVKHLGYHGDDVNEEEAVDIDKPRDNDFVLSGKMLKNDTRLKTEGGAGKGFGIDEPSLQPSAMNPHNFNMIINEPNKCIDNRGNAKPIFLIVLVTSVHKNAGLRQTVRETWGSVTEVSGLNIATVFLLAQTSDTKRRRDIDRESSRYRDVLLEDFLDSYENLTLKTIMGLKWVSNYCPQAKYVMKTDDDMFVSYENLVRYLQSPKTPSHRFVVGRTIHEAPIRDPNHKWFIPTSVYKGRLLPPFCSGSGYVLSGDIVPMIFRTSITIPYLSLEDVFVGLCLERLHVRPRRHIQFNNRAIEYSYCRYKTIFTAHLNMVSNADKYSIWKDLHETKQSHCNIPFWPGNDPIFV